MCRGCLVTMEMEGKTDGKGEGGEMGFLPKERESDHLIYFALPATLTPVKENEIKSCESLGDECWCAYET